MTTQLTPQSIKEIENQISEIADRKNRREKRLNELLQDVRKKKQRINNGDKEIEDLIEQIKLKNLDAESRYVAIISKRDSKLELLNQKIKLFEEERKAITDSLEEWKEDQKKQMKERIGKNNKKLDSFIASIARTRNSLVRYQNKIENIKRLNEENTLELEALKKKKSELEKPKTATKKKTVQKAQTNPKAVTKTDKK